MSFTTEEVTRLKRALALAVVALALVAFVAVPAQAATRVVCVANGFVDISGDGPYTWSVLGQGPCLDTLQGTFATQFSGTGTSDTLGLCDGLVVQNLSIVIDAVTTNLRTGAQSFTTQQWFAPITTFPVATPFLI
ncbi:MAG: hypothetical protein WAT66_15470, partial [Actinomycetota bacterium]